MTSRYCSFASTLSRQFQGQTDATLHLQPTPKSLYSAQLRAEFHILLPWTGKEESKGQGLAEAGPTKHTHTHTHPHTHIHT